MKKFLALVLVSLSVLPGCWRCKKTCEQPCEPNNETCVVQEDPVTVAKQKRESGPQIESKEIGWKKNDYR